MDALTIKLLLTVAADVRRRTFTKTRPIRLLTSAATKAVR